MNRGKTYYSKNYIWMREGRKRREERMWVQSCIFATPSSHLPKIQQDGFIEDSFKELADFLNHDVFIELLPRDFSIREASVFST
jgi:hypothetical protein